MKRRDFIRVLGSTAAWPLLVNAQTQSYRLAFIHSGLPADELTEVTGPFWVRHFFATLRRQGYVEGSNLIVERYSAGGQSQRFADLARAVISGQPNVIVANSNALVAALRLLTHTIPLVAIVADPVSTGLIGSHARPGGNLTGVSIDPGLEVYSKRLQLLKEFVPSADLVGYLASQREWESILGHELRQTGHLIGVTVGAALPRQATPEELRRVFGEARSAGFGALLVSASGDFLAHRQLIVGLAENARLPVMYPYRDYVESGGLVAYTPDLADTAERLAECVDQILRGAPPGEIPFHQAIRFELVINLKAAKVLSLAIPPAIVAQADEVIE